VRRTLEELPESLDETYERILKEIKKPNRGLAQRVLQCLVVAIRPLRVAELAEVLAVDFDDSEGIPRLNADWRWEDQEQALLIACSSLIVIVETGDSDVGTTIDVNSVVETSDGNSDAETGVSRVVQFSHFSVKEFLTSSRLSIASGEVSSYRIDWENAHTILAHACLGVLLETYDEVDRNTSKDHPLARYAAQHWATHAQFVEMSPHSQKGIEYLFNPDKPHFRVWRTLYDIDTGPDYGTTFYLSAGSKTYNARPLYYAALCGFYDLVEHLIAKYPQDVNADGGYFIRPLIAALAGEHFRTADLLRHNGADPNVQEGEFKSTPFHCAAYLEKFQVVQKLIEYGVDINARDGEGYTPLYWASSGSHFKDGSVIRLLLERGADVNRRSDSGFTPLHAASANEALEIMRLLVEHGADVEAVNGNGKTALQVMDAEARKGDQGRWDEIRRLLVEHGAKENTL
jgi:hypothetical protein